MTEYIKKDFKKHLNFADEWLNKTCVSKNYPPSFSHKLRSSHGGIKPPELCLELLVAFGSKTQAIIDPFVGAGSSLIAASLINKKATGIDINSGWVDIYQKVCQIHNLNRQVFLVGDSEKVLQDFQDKEFDLLLTDVPYFNMDKLPKTRGKFSRAGEETKDKLPTSLNKFNQEVYQSLDQWLDKMQKIFEISLPKLKNRSFYIIFIGNMYRNVSLKSNVKKKQGVYLNLSAELANRLTRIGLRWVKEIIWIDPGKKLGIYGYPYVWIPSLLDQRILIMQKVV